MSRKFHRYTKEQIDYIQSIAPGKTREEIKNMVNKRFNLKVTLGSIRSVMHRNGIKNKMQGYNTRFEKGHEPWSKGKKGINLGGEAGWFKKGNLPPSHLPVGSESIKEGRVFIKTDEPNVWEEKHRWLWEKHYGEIPEGTVIAFKDGDKQNVTIDNLFSTTPGARTAVVRRRLPEHHPELKIASHRLAELDIAIKKTVSGS